MNSVFSAFISDKSNTSALGQPNSVVGDKRKNVVADKKNIQLNEKNSYEKLRHIRGKMSNLVLNDDEISLKIPPANPKASTDSCKSVREIGAVNFSTLPLDKCSNQNPHSSVCSQDDSDFTCETLNKCSNNIITLGSANDIPHLKEYEANEMSSTQIWPLSDTSKSASNIFNTQLNSNNLSNTVRYRPSLSLSNVANGSKNSQQTQPAVHGRFNTNLSTKGRVRLSMHQRNLRLDFR